MKIVRTCPRCRANRYHPASRENDAKAACGVWCAECGHRWEGRLTQDEQLDFVEWKRRNATLGLGEGA